MSTAYPQIPYGWADFEAMRRQDRFLHELERERFAFLIRPRRFGKSCCVALLESYYDRNRAGRFEEIFAGTDIARQPTPNRHRYVILRFDFSAFDDTLETLRERFENYCLIALRYALEDNEDLFPQPVIDRILYTATASRDRPGRYGAAPCHLNRIDRSLESLLTELW